PMRSTRNKVTWPGKTTASRIANSGTRVTVSRHAVRVACQPRASDSAAKAARNAGSTGTDIGADQRCKPHAGRSGEACSPIKASPAPPQVWPSPGRRKSVTPFRPFRVDLDCPASVKLLGLGQDGRHGRDPMTGRRVWAAGVIAVLLV